MKNNLDAMYKYRSLWMGVAIIWIVFFHSKLTFYNSAVSFVKKVGYGGVDIFVFASGIGLYYSYTKEHSIIDFLKRRLIKLLPIYLIFMIIWLPYKIIADNMPLTMVIGNLFAVQGLTGLDGDFNWYISFIVISYLMAPILIELIDRISHSDVFILIIFLLVLSIPFWTTTYPIMLATRFPIFAHFV